MASYHCPYCGVRIAHRPTLAGSRVLCSECSGAYYEPTDPVPGITPEKAPAAESETSSPMAGAVAAKLTPSDEVPMASVVQAPILTPARADTAAQPQEESAGSPGSKELRSSQILAPLEQQGQKGILVSWEDGKAKEAKFASTKNCRQEEANDMVLRVALRLIKKRWPELYPLLSVRMDKSLLKGDDAG